jgi:hypothetical protein
MNCVRVHRQCSECPTELNVAAATLSRYGHLKRLPKRGILRWYTPSKGRHTGTMVPNIALYTAEQIHVFVQRSVPLLEGCASPIVILRTF